MNPVSSDKYDIEQFQFPLSINNQWEYIQKECYFNFNPDSMKSDNWPDTLVIKIEQKITAECILHDTVHTYLIRENITPIVYTLNREFNEKDLYYANSEDGLYEFGYYLRKKPNSWFKIKPEKSKYHFNNTNRNHSDYMKSNMLFFSKDDSINYRVPPIQILQYPLEVNKEWCFREHPIKIVKKIVGIEKVKVPAGEFDCYKIQSFYDFDEDGNWDENVTVYDYMSQFGLILRKISSKKIAVSGGVNPPGEFLFYVDHELKQELISYNIN